MISKQGLYMLNNTENHVYAYVAERASNTYSTARSLWSAQLCLRNFVQIQKELIIVDFLVLFSSPPEYGEENLR